MDPTTCRGGEGGGEEEEGEGEEEEEEEEEEKEKEEEESLTTGVTVWFVVHLMVVNCVSFII